MLFRDKKMGNAGENNENIPRGLKKWGCKKMHGIGDV